MTTKDKKDAAGKVLYCEFRKEGYTYQLIITPPAIGLDDMPKKMAVLRRKVSIWHPRRNWNTDKTRVDSVGRDSYGEFEKMDEYNATKRSEEILEGFYGSQFSNLVNQGWVIHKKPFAVEFTYEELAAVDIGKMPVSLYRRIERVRKNQGFEDSLFDDVTEKV